MQIYQTGIHSFDARKASAAASPHGFTLMELVVVIFIISLATALIMPTFWDSGERALRSEARRIGNTLRYIHDEAVGKKEVYRLKIDLDNDTWDFESQRESRGYHLAKDIIFKDVLIPSLGSINGGEITMDFGPLGPEEPITMHLSGNGKEYTVTFNHLNGRARIFEGYVL